MTKRASPPQRPKQSKQSQSVRQDVKAIEAEARAILKHQRELLKKSGQTIRDFRRDFASLRKKGIISKRKDSRSAEPSKYYRSKLKKFADVLTGKAVALPAPKAVRQKYTSKKLYPSSGRFLIIPKEHERQKTLIRKGQVEIHKPIGPHHTMVMITLPYDATDMLDLANKMEHDPSILDTPKSGGQYVFSMFGHNSRGFPDKQEMVNNIKIYYRHLFEGEAGEQAVQYFRLVEFKRHTSIIPDIADEYGLEKFYYGYRKGSMNATGRNNTWLNERWRKVRAAQKKTQRTRMTPEQKEEYKRKARIRAAQSEQRRRDEK